MSDLEDSFAVLLGRQPTDRERQNLYRVRDALKLKTTDAIWLLLMALQYYEKLYEQFPSQIAGAAREVTSAVRATAEAEARAAQEAARLALMKAVHDAAKASAAKAAGTRLATSVSIAASLVCVSPVAVGWSSFRCGRATGAVLGNETGKRECADLFAASSWAHTPEGKLAYAFSKAGGLEEAARCTGRGMVSKDGWCIVPSERGRPLARWPLPVTGFNNMGGK